MSLKPEDIQSIAHLARLQIDEKTIARYSAELSRILALVEQMNAIDTRGIAPLAHPLDVTRALREDCVTETSLRDRFQSIAPLVDQGFYCVPKVIE